MKVLTFVGWEVYTTNDSDNVQIDIDDFMANFPMLCTEANRPLDRRGINSTRAKQYRTLCRDYLVFSAVEAERNDVTYATKYSRGI